MNPVDYSIDFLDPFEGLRRGQELGTDIVRAPIVTEQMQLQNEGLGYQNEAARINNLTLEERNNELLSQMQLTNERLQIENLTWEERTELTLEQLRLTNEAARLGNKDAAARLPFLEQELRDLEKQRSQESEARQFEIDRAPYTRDLTDEYQKLINEGLRREGRLADETTDDEIAHSARIAELFEKIADGTATPQDYQILSALVPKEQSEAVLASLEEMTEQQKEAEVASLAPIFSAFHSGADGVAIGLLRDRAEALRNSGRTDEADYFDSLVTTAESGPEGARMVEANIGYIMTQFPTGTDVMEGAYTYWQMQNTIDEMNQRGLPEDLSQTDIWRMETQLRGEYTKLSTALRQAQLDFSKAISSVDDTGAGDVALVFSFMRMLDPGSVVRESEFAQARDTTGLMDELRVAWAHLDEGESLSPTQRQNFLSLSQDYLDAANSQAEEARIDLSIVADNWGLEKTNIFGNDAQVDIDTMAGLNDLRTAIGIANPGVNGIFRMSREEIAAQFPNGYAEYVAQNGEPVVTVDW